MSKPPHNPSDGSPTALMHLFANAVPPSFTVPVIALKAFIPSLTAVFVLGCVLAIGMSLYITRSTNEDLLWRVLENCTRGFLMTVTCFAWLLIIDESAANEIVNKFILGNSVDDHTYIIRFTAGAIIVFRIITLGYNSTSKSITKVKSSKDARSAHA